MKCPQCGFEATGKFCSNCGAKLEPAAEEQEKIPVTPDEMPDGQEAPAETESVENAATETDIPEEVIPETIDEQTEEEAAEEIPEAVLFTAEEAGNMPKRERKKRSKKAKVIGAIAVIVVLAAVLFALLYCNHGNAIVRNDYYGASCAEFKVIHYSCPDCGKEWDKETEEYGAHDYSEWTTTVEPTCTKKGTQERTCSVCGEKKSEALDAAGHKWEVTEVITEADCTNEGQATQTCSVCGETETVTLPVEKDKHTYSNPAYDWSSAYKSGDVVKASAKTVCSVCGKEISDSIEVSASDFKAACGSYSWADLRTMHGNPVVVKVVVTQELSGHALARISGTYDKLILIRDCGAYEDTTLTVYGKADGEYTYTTVLGASKTVPCIKAFYY